MRALTGQQPYADAVFWTPPKDVENRSQLWTHRGPLAIHAGQRFSVDGGRDMQIVRHPDYALADLAFGAVIGVVDVIEAHRYEPGCCESPWGQPYGVHLCIDRPRRLPIPIRAFGKLGLWTLTAEVAREVRRQLVGSVRTER